MITYIYTPTRDYPKEPQMDLSDEERDSFNINNKAQVAEIINLVLKEIYKNDESKPGDNTLFN
ncbi:MAG: hypothetical protein GXP17_04960, partial [Gammaproteobacteria bacterium]|nr:hypothetical protein [Gammaproteobacteria bacterium]